MIGVLKTCWKNTAPTGLVTCRLQVGEWRPSSATTTVNENSRHCRLALHRSELCHSARSAKQGARRCGRFCSRRGSHKLWQDGGDGAAFKHDRPATGSDDRGIGKP